MTDRLAAALRLESPANGIAGVSSARAAVLSRLGIRSVRDMLRHYPRRYIDMSALATIADATIGKPATIVAQVHEVNLKHPKPKLDLVEVTLVDGTSTLIATFFRQPWLAKTLVPGTRVSVAGTVEFNYGFKRMTMPFLDRLESDDAVDFGRIVSVHAASEKLPAGQIRRLISNALAEVAGAYDPLPLEIRTRYRLMSRANAWRAIHFPRSSDELRQARRRLVYEEILMLELYLMRQEKRRASGKKPCVHIPGGPCFDSLFASLPFDLTDDQLCAIEDIGCDMVAERAMNRMVLGDVGTGKTVVAAFAIAIAADSGTQALMMGPTEVLVQQYASSLGPLLDRAGISWGLLSASASREDRQNCLASLASGELSVLFGTHALLEDDVVCKSCSLVIVDEEQRFGVDQRDCLRAKGDNPDYLSLTATPIPRSLALALYGATALSYVRQKPGNAAGRTTRVIGFRQRGVAYDAALEACKRGEQAYVVCPLVGKKPPRDASPSSRSRKADFDFSFEEEDASYIDSDYDMLGDNPKAAEAEAAFLQAKTFSEYSVGLLHGKMKPAEKREVMDRFRAGEIDVLVSTTVIEVGVDVPNATVMIVEDADRFGLAQLHQLRGRIGRAEKPGQAFLVASTSDSDAMKRLSAMERTEDGFELAEFDLSFRREGDVLGSRQHGSSMLKLVNIVRDRAVVEAAHGDALRLMSEEPGISSCESRILYHELDAVFPPDGAY